MNKKIKPLILASKSPYRADILRAAGLEIETYAAKIDERCIESDLMAAGKIDSPKMLSHILAVEKAYDVAKHFPERLVLGADQVLDFYGEILHKPKTYDEVRERLALFSDKEHYLHSAVVLVKGNKMIWSGVETACLKMRALSTAFIETYIEREKEKLLSSVGAYRIEGMGIQLFEKIEGNFFTIIGMPLLGILSQLRDLGVIDA